MKRFNYYLGLLLMLVFVTSCHEEFDQPPVYIPVAEAVPNMTIAEFKAKHWQDDANYVDTITENEVIHGWVTANDISNNIYRTIYISDGSAGMSISIHQSELYEKYRIGQEIVLPMKDHYVGKATGQMYIAAPYLYVSKSGQTTLECLNMSSKEMDALVQFNQLPDVSKVDTIDANISDFQDKFDTETLQKYQGLLLRFRDVEFVEADGVTTYAMGSTPNRTIMDANGNKLIVRNSSYSDFADHTLPLGRFDVVGVLGFYQISSTSAPTWQLYLRTESDVMGEGEKGSKALPYSVAEAIGVQTTSRKVWVEGYIVGAVGPEVTTVSSNADIDWTVPAQLDNTIVIADDPECKDYTKCIIVPLAVGSVFRANANLKTNTNVYKALVKVQGIVAPYMGMTCITENMGSKDEYVLDVAYTELKEEFSGGIPDTWTNLNVSGSSTWTTTSFNNDTYAKVTGYGGKNPPFDIWLITPKLDIKKAKSKVFNFESQVNNYGNLGLEVYLMDTNDPRTATVMVQLNPTLATKPTSSPYSGWVKSGDIDLSEWSDGVYYVGFHYYAPLDLGNNYTTWCIDNVTFGMGAPANRADFETMGDARGQFVTLTSTKGWVGTNCCLFQGGASDQNPTFQFIGFMPDGTTPAKAPTLNGKTSAAGTLVSPVIKGGMTGLSFNYGAAMSDKVLSFRIDVKQNGNVVQSWTETKTEVTQKMAYTFTRSCNVRGDFTIEITNLCPSNSTSNKDRVSIWNLVWEPID